MNERFTVTMQAFVSVGTNRRQMTFSAVLDDLADWPKFVWEIEGVCQKYDYRTQDEVPHERV